MDDWFAWGCKALADQPFSRLLGAELVRLERGYAELRVPIKHELKQHYGFVHGGVLSYAADNALTYVGATVLDALVVTSEFKINYVRPGLGDYILARATLVHAGRNQAVCRCDVFVSRDGSEKLCAVAQGTIVKAGQQQVPVEPAS
jgi:uncharacterized protein (TIGR00369 family)